MDGMVWRRCMALGRPCGETASRTTARQSEVVEQLTCGHHAAECQWRRCASACRAATIAAGSWFARHRVIRVQAAAASRSGGCGERLSYHMGKCVTGWPCWRRCGAAEPHCGHKKGAEVVAELVPA